MLEASSKYYQELVEQPNGEKTNSTDKNPDNALENNQPKKLETNSEQVVIDFEEDFEKTKLNNQLQTKKNELRQLIRAAKDK